MSRNDRLSIGPRITGLWLRLLAVIVAVTAAILLDVPFGWLVTVAIVTALGSLFPMMGGIWVGAAVLIGALAVRPAEPTEVAAVIAAVHLLHVVGSLSLVVPLSARVSVRALVPTLINFAVVQVIAQAVGLAAVMLPRQGTASAAVIAGSAAVVAIAAGALWLWHRHRLDSFSDATG